VQTTGIRLHEPNQAIIELKRSPQCSRVVFRNCQHVVSAFSKHLREFPRTDFDRIHCLDCKQLLRILSTQERKQYRRCFWWCVRVNKG